MKLPAHLFAARHQRGLTLIELMVAMVLGLLVAAGIITVFMSTSFSNKAQKQMAHLQENGRFAMSTLKRDIGMANAQYCTASGGNARSTQAGPYLDGLRAPMIYARVNGGSNTPLVDALHDVTTPWGSPYPAQPNSEFSLPTYLSMRGYNCDKTGCQPEDPHTRVADIPATGTDVGDRVKGTDVLTLRYLDPSAGWRIGRTGGSTINAGSDGRLQQVNLSPLEDEPPVSHFKPGDLAMLANCSSSQVFAASGQGSSSIKPTGGNYTQPSAMVGTAGLRLFDFDRAYKTVTFYVRMVEDGSGNKTGALVRRSNGESQEMVRGIERLDFRYGVMSDHGRTRFLDADEVDQGVTNAGTTIPCPANVPDPVDSANHQGCLWRAVKSVETDLVMDGQRPLHSLDANQLAYTYAGDDITDTAKPPDDHDIQPNADQGFPKNLMRREFTSLISVRNYNP